MNWKLVVSTFLVVMVITALFILNTFRSGFIFGPYPERNEWSEGAR